MASGNANMESRDPVKAFRHAIVAVMGPTGAGKSSFIAGITGLDAGVCRTLHSGTKSISSFDLKIGSNTVVTLVDTPGFDDTFNTDHDTLHEIAEWLSRGYEEGQLLSGILYLQPITKNRIEGSTRRCLSLFEKLCGPHNLKNVLLVTTFWNDVEEEVGQRRETELITTEGLWKELKERGARTERMSRDYDRYHSILQNFVKGPAITLQIQDEMKSGKSLSETMAGLHLDAELHKLQEEQENRLQKMQTDFQHKLNQQDQQKRQHYDRLWRERANWEEQEARRRKEKREQHEVQLRKMEADQERERQERQKRLDLMARIAAQKEADLKRQMEEEARNKYLQVLDQAKLKFRASMLQEQQIESQLDLLRVCGQAGMVRIRCPGITLHGKGRYNTDKNGQVIKTPWSLLQGFCDMCRMSPGSGAYMQCKKQPCPVTGDNDLHLVICSSCWDFDDWHLLEGRTCEFERFQTPDPCRRANQSRNLLCDRCRSSNTATGQIEGVFFHCHACDEDDFDLCLQCVLNGARCRDMSHSLIWGVTKVDLGQL